MSGFASDPSSHFFVPRVKGEGERAAVVAATGPASSVVVYRPGLLRCPRREESRPMESVARWISDIVDVKATFK